MATDLVNVVLFTVDDKFEENKRKCESIGVRVFTFEEVMEAG